VFCVLIKRPVKFEDVSTFLTIRTSNNIEFNKNSKLAGGLNIALEPYGVQLRQERSLFLLL